MAIPLNLRKVQIAVFGWRVLTARMGLFVIGNMGLRIGGSPRAGPRLSLASETVLA